MDNFKLQLNNLISILYKSLDSYNQIEELSRNEFKLIVKSSFIKQLEILHLLSTENKDRSKILFIPLLRGSCEDLIALKYIKHIFGLKSNRLVRLQVTLGINKSLSQQKLFFNKYRPNQIVLTEAENVLTQKAKKEYEELLKSKGITGKKLPSTEIMAKEIELTDLYEFIFRGTSDFVHFNNGILARMAWKNKLGNFHISINNFNEYYSSFSYFYSAFVFSFFCETFKSEVRLSTSDWEIIKKMKTLIESEAFWPEIVTFEEMNIRRPQQISRILTESLQKLERGN